MEDHEITKDELVKAIRKTQNWKAAGVDKIQNYWYKNFTTLHDRMVIIINEVIEQPSR